jgi:hypothetical protein
MINMSMDALLPPAVDAATIASVGATNPPPSVELRRVVNEL